MQKSRILTPKEIILPDGTKTDNYSQEYQRYCEALNLSKRPLHERRQFLNKLQCQDRIEKLKYWLTLIWNSRS